MITRYKTREKLLAILSNIFYHTKLLHNQLNDDSRSYTFYQYKEESLRQGKNLLEPQKKQVMGANTLILYEHRLLLK